VSLCSDGYKKEEMRGNMFRNFRLIVMLVGCVVICLKVQAQTFSVGFTSVWTHTNQVVKMVHSEEDFQNTDYCLSLCYEQVLKNKQYVLFGSFSRFSGNTWIKFSEGSVIAPDGFPVGVQYNLLSAKKRFYLRPFLGFGIQISRKTGDEIWAEYLKTAGPDYAELEPVTAEPLNTVQVVPTLGFKTGIALWRRLDLSFTVQGVYGFKSYQNMFYKYAYRGVPQETAVFEATGTGMFYTLGIGYRFRKL
jgi:hypothetical protein